MLAVWKREVQSYFHTTIGYHFLGVFWALSSVLFYLYIMQPRSSDLLTFIGLTGYLWMLLSPILTMRLLADERQKRTDQLLLTSPVSVPGIVIGKYLAAFTVMMIAVLGTLIFVAVVAVYGQIYAAELIVGYAGFILEGAAFLAVDLYMSSLASNSVTAALLAFGANFVLWLLDLLAGELSVGWVAGSLSFLGIYGRNEPFFNGQLSFASVIYDLSVAALFIAFTVHRIDSRRYRGA